MYLNFWQVTIYIYTFIYIFIKLINNSRRKDKGNQWHDGGCISDTKFNIVDKHEHLDVGVS